MHPVSFSFQKDRRKLLLLYYEQPGSFLLSVSFHSKQHIFVEVSFFFSPFYFPLYSNNGSSSSDSLSTFDVTIPSSLALDSLLISIFQPVNFVAKRAFCPRFPIANDSW